MDPYSESTRDTKCKTDEHIWKTIRICQYKIDERKIKTFVHLNNSSSDNRTKYIDFINSNSSFICIA